MNLKAKSRDSFIFYRSFYEATRELPISEQGYMYNAIAEYVLIGVIPKFEVVSKLIWILIKPQLDANIKRYEDGKKYGQRGAKYGKLGGRPKKTKKPPRNPVPRSKKTL